MLSVRTVCTVHTVYSTVQSTYTWSVNFVAHSNCPCKHILLYTTLESELISMVMACIIIWKKLSSQDCCSRTVPWFLQIRTRPPVCTSLYCSHIHLMYCAWYSNPPCSQASVHFRPLGFLTLPQFCYNINVLFLSTQCINKWLNQIWLRSSH